jgi:hypothetical protein
MAKAKKIVPTLPMKDVAGLIAPYVAGVSASPVVELFSSIVTNCPETLVVDNAKTLHGYIQAKRIEAWRAKNPDEPNDDGAPKERPALVTELKGAIALAKTGATKAWAYLVTRSQDTGTLGSVAKLIAEYWHANAKTAPGNDWIADAVKAAIAKKRGVSADGEEEGEEEEAKAKAASVYLSVIVTQCEAIAKKHPAFLPDAIANLLTTASAARITAYGEEKVAADIERKAKADTAKAVKDAATKAAAEAKAKADAIIAKAAAKAAKAAKPKK